VVLAAPGLQGDKVQGFGLALCLILTPLPQEERELQGRSDCKGSGDGHARRKAAHSAKTSQASPASRF